MTDTVPRTTTFADAAFIGAQAEHLIHYSSPVRSPKLSLLTPNAAQRSSEELGRMGQGQRPRKRNLKAYPFKKL